jgi:hypothetical protein
VKSLRRCAVSVLAWSLVGCLSPFLPRGRAETVESRVAKLEKTMAPRWKDRFEKVGAPLPPDRVLLTFFKDERRLPLHVPAKGGHFVELASWKVLAASGVPGPKLREGDEQVPEGVYPIWSLNPNSRFHLSLHVGYPNAADRAQAAKEGRRGLGGDIMIHGSFVSVGCIAIGDAAIEEVFYLAAVSPLKGWRLVSLPTDLRQSSANAVVARHPWIKAVYDEALDALRSLGSGTGRPDAP